MRNAFEESIVDGKKVIDFHTHPYTSRVEYMGMYGEDFYLEPEQMPEDLADAGIGVFCGSVIDSDHRGPVGSFDEIRRVNDSALKLWKKFGDAYVPGFHVHPAFLRESLEEVERMKKYPNLYLDISGTGLFRYGLLASAVKTVGAGRILFGTDYPICNPRMYVEAVLGEHISQKEKEDILFGNAQRILGI